MLWVILCVMLVDVVLVFVLFDVLVLLLIVKLIWSGFCVFLWGLGGLGIVNIWVVDVEELVFVFLIIVFLFGIFFVFVLLYGDGLFCLLFDDFFMFFLLFDLLVIGFKVFCCWDWFGDKLFLCFELLFCFCDFVLEFKFLFVRIFLLIFMFEFIWGVGFVLLFLWRMFLLNLFKVFVVLNIVLLL